MTTQIDVINESTVVADNVIAKYVADIQTQITRDFSPAWGRREAVSLNFVPHGSKGNAGHWWMIVADNSDQAGALGYHDLTTADLPIGYCFAATDQLYGSSVSVTLSHELLEMLGDSRINRMAQMSDGLLYMVEACDAVEADALGYDINGTLVSNFVLPSWWDPQNKKGPFDFKNILKGPCPVLAQGGYIGYLDPNTGQWGQVFDKTMSKNDRIRARPYVRSRRYRRALKNRESSELVNRKKGK